MQKNASCSFPEAWLGHPFNEAFFGAIILPDPHFSNKRIPMTGSFPIYSLIPPLLSIFVSKHGWTGYR
ncbi:hypothetical protein [Paenibacillus mendelii]|uniref:Uncharacterized protein n=1 Tax=Paenibacillus mendelii TaxID=206163 RepID=A0ABV6JJ28_9BACL|nr:hypothetical protein [Paenibacillus mendelii]MCQ6558838.1 hypothetical protein [Paenibacillus mendelii]